MDTRVRTRVGVVVVVVVVIVAAAANALRPCGGTTMRAMADVACMRQQYRRLVHCVKPWLCRVELARLLLL